MLFKYLGPYYVYALIDPETCIPFYIGKGKTNRLVEHFRKSGDTSSFDKAELVGMSPEELLELSGQAEKGETAKRKKLDELEKKNFGPRQIARVICRRVTEEAAFAIEACLIKSVYGLQRLTNIQDGHHTERYRPHHPDKFEPNIEDKSASVGLEIGAVLEDNQFYVYALNNPKTGQIFYVGKGRGKRVLDHFSNARSNSQDVELSEKLAELRALLNEGFAENDIANILALKLSEDMAFLIESLFIRFVYGYARLTNVQPGHHSHLFRAHGDWELRAGLDIPIVVKKGQPRDELRDDFFGQDVHLHLYNVRDALLQDPLASGLVFSPPKVEGAGELCIDATIDNLIRLRIQSRGVRSVQVFLIGTGKSEQEVWMVKHFSLLQKFPYHRSDFRFSPIAWRGAKNVTRAVSTAVTRALILIRIARAESLNDLPAEILTEVLSDYPYPRQLTAKERKILGL